MGNELMYYVRLFFQILSLFIILYSLQTHSKENLIKTAVFFSVIYTLSCIFDIFQLELYTHIALTTITIILISLFYKKDLIDSSIDYAVFLVLSFPISLIVELIFSLIGLFSAEVEPASEIVIILYMVIMSIISFLVYLFIPSKKLIDKHRGILRTFFLIIFNLFIFYFMSRQDFLTNSNTNIAFILLSYIAIIISNIFLFKEFWKAKNKEKMIRQHNELIKNFDSVIADIRGKQHDFKNHINTLSNLCFTDKSTYEEIASSYISSINEQISNIDYLTASSNKILGSILYSKSCICNLKGIEFSFYSDNQEITFPLEDFELTSVFGNLIDNAVEFLEQSDILEKEIIVKIGQENEEKFFEVSNTGNMLPTEISHKIFLKGYTTKKQNKKNHGYGLYNTKKIVSKYGGSISITYNTPYVTFRVSFKS